MYDPPIIGEHLYSDN